MFATRHMVKAWFSDLISCAIMSDFVLRLSRKARDVMCYLSRTWCPPWKLVRRFAPILTYTRFLLNADRHFELPVLAAFTGENLSSNSPCEVPSCVLWAVCVLLEVFVSEFALSRSNSTISCVGSRVISIPRVALFCGLRHRCAAALVTPTHCFRFAQSSAGEIHCIY